jgi:hypothetical protein
LAVHGGVLSTLVLVRAERLAGEVGNR